MIHGHAANSRGKKQSPTYNSWRSMVQRCRNRNHAYSSTYYPLGYCSEWADFSNFLKDMGERPEGTTLDRVDTLKGYCKENCRWASPSKQMRNRKDNVLTEAAAQEIVTRRAAGEQLKAIASSIGVNVSTVKNVLYKGYWR